MRATTSGIGRAGMARCPTTEADSCTGDPGSPSDCPLLYVMPTRSARRLNPAEPEMSIRPTVLALTRRAASAIAGWSTAQRAASMVRVRRRPAMAATAPVIRSRVSIAAPAAASASASAAV